MISFSICVVRDEKTAFLLHPSTLEYFADPFVLGVRGNCTYVLVERYARLSRKGEIAVVAIDFTAGKYRLFPLISEAFHLSYPCVVRREDGIYVTPESEADSHQHFYRVDWQGHDLRAERVSSIPGRYVDLTVRSIGGDEYVAEFYNGTSNSNGLLIEMKLCFDGRVAVLSSDTLVVKGRHRPAGSLERAVQPYQRTDVSYGSGVDLLGRGGLVAHSSEGLLPPVFLASQDRSHHVHQHGGVIAFDICRPVVLRPHRQAFFETPDQVGARLNLGGGSQA